MKASDSGNGEMKVSNSMSNLEAMTHDIWDRLEVLLILLA